MRKITILVLSLLVSAVALSTDLSTCLTTIQELFKEKHNQEKLQEFMRLQGKITLHKLTYSLFQNDLNENRLRVEDKILKLTDQLDDKTKKDAEFLEIKKEFEANPLSRESLAKILPYIQNILTSQIEIEDTYDREHFILNSNDVKMLAVLAEGEEGDDRLFRNRSKKQSILNFTKVINSSLRGRTMDEGLKKHWEKEIEKNEKKLDDLLKSLPIQDECKDKLITSCKEKDSPSIFRDIFLKFATKFLDFDQREKLRYDDFWLHVTGKRSFKGRVSSPPLPLPDRSPQSREQDGETVDEGISQDPLFLHLKKKVLDKYIYFFTGEYLDQHPDLVYLIARAMDKGETTITYEGKQYRLPEVYNHKNYREIPIAQGLLARFFDRGDYNTTNHCMNQERQVYNLKRYVRGLKNYNEDQGTNIPTFSYLGDICDGKTGERLPKTPEAFFRYPVGDAVQSEEEENFASYPKERQDLIKRAIAHGDDSYIYQGKLYHLSGAKGTVQDGEDIMLAKARLEQLETAVVNGKLLDVRTMNPIHLTQSQQRIERYLASLPGDHQPNLSSSRPEYLMRWHEAIDADKEQFEYNGESYSTFTGAPVKKRETLQVDGREYMESSYFHQELDRINTLNDKDLIREYHRFLGGKENPCDHYTIVDKENSTTQVFSNDGNELYSREVLLGQTRGDERTLFTNYEVEGGSRKTNSKTGAGIYYTEEFKSNNEHPYYKLFNGQLLSLRSEYRDDAIVAFHQVPNGYESRMSRFDNGNLSDNRVSGGCINLAPADFMEYQSKFPGRDCPVYILPEDHNNRFQIIKGKLVFTPRDRSVCNDKTRNACNNNFNYSELPRSEDPKRIKISYDKQEILGTVEPEDRQETDVLISQFLNTIEESKDTLMKKLHLSNAEYNTLAKIALGVFEVESEFSQNKRYFWKEQFKYGQQLVDLAQLTLRGSDTANSRGLTQIKNVNAFMKLYGFRDIDEESLKEPRNAAKATMVVLADLLKTLKVESKSNGDILDFSTSQSAEESMNKYLYYLYQGRRGQISDRRATPALSPQAKRIQKVVENMEIFQEL